MFDFIGDEIADNRVVKQIRKSLLKIYKKNKSYTMDLIKLIEEELDSNNIIVELVEKIREHDEYTFHHSIEVGFYSMMVGYVLGFERDELIFLLKSGLLHDVGKINIGMSILGKPGKLTLDEFDEIKKHPGYSYDLIVEAGLPEDIAEVASNHHERIDGSGYPNHKLKRDLGKYSSIIAVCDIYSAMTSDRVYKKGVSPLTAYNIMFSEMNSKVELHYLEALVEAVMIFDIGAKVRLSNGEQGVVIGFSTEDFNLPIVKIPSTLNKYDLSVESDLRIAEVLKE